MPVDVQLFDDLDAVAADADGALDRDRQASLFDRLDWFRATLAHCPPRGRTLVARARAEGRSAWLFLAADRGNAVALASWYTLRFALVGDTAPALAEAIARTLRARLHHLALQPLDSESAAGLTRAFAAAGWRTDTTRVSANWSIAIPAPDAAAYLAARPKRLRETIRRKARTAPVDIAIHEVFDAAAWQDYAAVYAASWKPEEGSLPFLRSLAEQEGAAGALRLGIARANGAPVAAQLWLTERGIATIHKLAHVEAARAGSPGTLLSAAMFRHAIDVDRVHRVDFGTGDEPYKADWMDARAPLYRVDAWNQRTMRGLAGGLRARAAALVRGAPKV